MAGFNKLTSWVKRALWSCLLEQCPRIQLKEKAGLRASSSSQARCVDPPSQTNGNFQLARHSLR